MHASPLQSLKHNLFKKTAMCRIPLEKVFFEITFTNSIKIFQLGIPKLTSKFINLEEKVFFMLQKSFFFSELWLVNFWHPGSFQLYIYT